MSIPASESDQPIFNKAKSLSFIFVMLYCFQSNSLLSIIQFDDLWFKERLLCPHFVQEKTEAQND